MKVEERLLKLVLRLINEERLELLKWSSSKLQKALLKGLRPDIRDMVAMPWLLRYLMKL